MCNPIIQIHMGWSNQSYTTTTDRNEAITPPRVLVETLSLFPARLQRFVIVNKLQTTEQNEMNYTT